MILSALGVSAVKFRRPGRDRRESIVALDVHRAKVPARSDFSLDIVFH
jgi:hypothetical protein